MGGLKIFKGLTIGIVGLVTLVFAYNRMAERDTYQYQSMSESEPAQTTSKQAWYSHDLNHRNCMEALSPADRIRDLQSWGKTARVRDLSGGAVEVESDLDSDRVEVWTFYRSEYACEASLPRNQAIDPRYE
jgi:hypothetical protein